MKIKPFFWTSISFGLLFFLFALGLGDAHASARDPQPATDAYALIAEVNALRTASGLPAYTVNATLMAVAQAHTDYQASTGTVTHYSADGSRPYQRALAAGYPVGGNLAAGGYFSENIVANMGLSPAGAVQSWQGDAPHLNTMLSPYLTEVGAGVTTSGGLTYYTLDASTPSGAAIPVYTTPDPNATLDPNMTPDDVNGALPPLDWIMPVITSTPDESGKVIHEVQVGQSLWGIADVYGTTVQELRTLNYMGVDDAVFPGELLLVRQVATPLPATATLAPTLTATIVPPTIPVLTETSLPTSEALSSVEDEQPAQPLHFDSSIWTVLGIILIALLMAALVTWLSSREQL